MKDIKVDILDKITSDVKKEMESIWFTADLHAQHPKIVDICNRPVYLSQEEKIILSNLEKEELIKSPDYKILNSKQYKSFINPRNDEWIIKDVINNTVGRKDTLYILGDVTMANKIASDKFLDRLNGDKRLIEGNHDQNIRKSTRFGEITKIKDFTYNNKTAGIKIHIVLCHYPMLTWNRRVHGTWSLFGHVHCRQLEGQDKLSFDVGIDRIGIWRPYNLYEICMIMYKKSMGILEEEILRSL